MVWLFCRYRFTCGYYGEFCYQKVVLVKKICFFVECLFRFALWKTLSHCIIFYLLYYFYLLFCYFISYFYFVFVYGSTSLCGSTTGHSILCSFIWYCSKYDNYLYLKSPLYFCVVVRRKRWDSNSGDYGGTHLGLPLGHFRWG